MLFLAVTWQSASSVRAVLMFLEINCAHAGFQRWSFASGRASDWRQVRRVRKGEAVHAVRNYSLRVTLNCSKTDVFRDQIRSCWLPKVDMRQWSSF